MKKTLHKLALVLLVGLTPGALLAADGGGLQAAGVDLSDRGSLQRGAKYYMSYCAACHSLKYMRYSRIGEDLGLSEDEVRQNLMFKQDTQIGDNVLTGIDPALGEQFFGKAPPDLSVISRVRGDDWIYTYLKSFYLDGSRPLGWNNTLFPNVSMPNPLFELQGLQHPVFTGKVETGEKDDSGAPVMACAPGTFDAEERCIETLTVTQAGRLKPAEFDQVVRDITGFLAYSGEPAGLKRQGIGVWVLAFLAIFTFLAWLLKREYWKDVD
ncbi:cytochrome c1 [Luteimonas sp. e5]